MFVFVVTLLIFCLIIVVVLFVVGLENYLIVLTLIVCIFLTVIFFCNNSKECFCVDFPIYMYSSVKFVKLGCNTYDFVESLSVVLVKKCC